MQKDYLGYNILVVEDEKYLRELIVENLKNNLKSTIYEAECGLDALKILEKNRIDLSILDIKMPGMSGIELLHEIDSKWPETVNLILTAHVDKNHFLDAIKYHVYDFLEKPCQKEVLLNRVKKALNFKYHKKLLYYATLEFLKNKFNNFNAVDFEKKSFEEKNKVLEMALSLLSMQDLKKVENE